MEPGSLARKFTEERIVDAAAHLFARHGFKAATTREIAQLADLNEVTLFRYFLRKPDLFWAAVELRLSRVKLGPELETSLAGDEDPSTVVPKIVTFFVDTMAQQPELHRLLYVAAFELPESDQVIHQHLGPIFEAMSAYFRRCAQKGLIHNVASSLPTLGILGTVVAHSNLHQFIAGCRSPFHSLEEEAAAYAALWLRALVENCPATNSVPVGTE